MNWLDEGALYSQIALFLREDLGRGDITSQAIIARNTRARGRFVSAERMIVAGLEAAEEVFLTLDSQQQLEAFASDGEEVQEGKVIARITGFADILLAGEQVALNLIQRLSGIATATNRFVHAIEGTKATIVDSREITPGLRMLEKYAVLLGGGRNLRTGLDDGISITLNHIAMVGDVTKTIVEAKNKLGNLYKIEMQIESENQLRQAIAAGADTVLIENLTIDQTSHLTDLAHQLSPAVRVRYSGNINLENVRGFAEAGVDMISLGTLTTCMNLAAVDFKLQPF